MTDMVLTRVAALKTTPTPSLKKMWQELFDTEPPAYNCRFLESRLAYHIQELAYGGLSRATLERLVNRRQDRVHPHSRCSGIGLEHHHFKQLREYGDVADRIWHDRTWFA